MVFTYAKEYTLPTQPLLNLRLMPTIIVRRRVKKQQTQLLREKLREAIDCTAALHRPLTTSSSQILELRYTEPFASHPERIDPGDIWILHRIDRPKLLKQKWMVHCLGPELHIQVNGL